MKRSLSIILFIALLSTLACTNVFAGSQDAFVFGDKEVTILTPDLSDEMKDRIAEYLVSEEDSIAVCGLMCTLFGHDIEYSSARVTTHNLYPDPPKCLEETFAVEACRRCDYFQKELLFSTRINCHQ